MTEGGNRIDILIRDMVRKDLSQTFEDSVDFSIKRNESLSTEDILDDDVTGLIRRITVQGI